MKRKPQARKTSSETDTDSESGRIYKRYRSSSTDGSEGGDGSRNRPVKVYIVQAKFDDQTLRDLFDLVELAREGKGPSVRPLNLEICKDPEDADIIITNIRMRKRFERHVDWRIAVRHHHFLLAFRTR